MRVLFENKVNDFIVYHPFGEYLLIQIPSYIEPNGSIVLVNRLPDVAILDLFLNVLEFFHSPYPFFKVWRKQEASRYLQLIELKYFVPFFDVLSKEREDTDKPLEFLEVSILDISVTKVFRLKEILDTIPYLIKNLFGNLLLESYIFELNQGFNATRKHMNWQPVILLFGPKLEHANYLVEAAQLSQITRQANYKAEFVGLSRITIFEWVPNILCIDLQEPGTSFAETYALMDHIKQLELAHDDGSSQVDREQRIVLVA